MGNTTKLAAAVALLVLTGCATQPPQGAVTCETQERKFRDLHKAGELKAASQAFSNLIKDCPATLTGTLRSRVLPFMRDLLTDSALDDTSYRIHGSLFTSGWTAETDTETDYFWLQLVQRHLQHGSVRAARQVSQKIVEPASLLQMRVDRRFDALVSADPSHFDIAAAIERNLARRRAEAAAAPRALEPWMRLTAALAGAGRYQETLDAANDAIARGPQAFDEYSKLYPWLLTAKGWA
ncbi:MAG: hypothetical protein ABI769_17125, partial [Pseudomonadota bacterium]